ncbi:Type II secretion system protein G [Planctomycetes bacterium LzC2]|uniref:Type II secretion system protein G n=2 Tax=Alienimonas chondri TaxID=2681879 RepID=A0ABX1VC92_9PLAN|nr:Type II secretion system protein G [Alienimonas chondri]
MRGGFTLVEVLLVLAILGVIAALVVPNLLGSQQKANINATRVKITSYQSAIEQYAIDHNGRPPAGSADEVNQLLMNPEPIDGRNVDPYLRESPKDGWGEPLFYQFPAKNQTISTDPDIWSAGPNGQNEDGGGDDINNWSTVGT